ncbi:MAG: polyprenyl synthetase family protein [Lachnospiraceae bacterium]|nr:polyprenyl synthetase family protein [Lachnospiraceae bacterium]
MDKNGKEQIGVSKNVEISTDKFKQILENKTEDINRLLAGFLPQEVGEQTTVISAVNYSVNAGGKRLRPIFLVGTNELCGGEGIADPLVAAFAAAIEMIHTYSLVHDDLPAMDNDKYRRGKLTTHAKYGEAMGILAGDALLNLAFEIAAGALEKEKEPERILAGAKALSILSVKSGIWGMIGGQSVDVEKTGQPFKEGTLDFIYRLKTAALLEAAVMIGGVLSGVTKGEADQLGQMGTAIGMAFQIQDDILDITGNEKVLGKPIHSDEKNHKTTYVTLHPVKKAREEVKRLTGEAIQILLQFDKKKGRDATFLIGLVDLLSERER